MKNPERDVKTAYEAIKAQKSKFGVYHKVCFHIHTPSSHDYRLIDGWTKEQYLSSTEEDIYKLCVDHKVFLDKVTLEDIELSGKLTIYESKKEFLSFLLLANALIDNSIEIAVVTDHNSIDGIDKLRQAVKEIKTYKGEVCPEILLGIEISCADKNHVVGIFDDNNISRQEIKSWMAEHLIDVEDGTIKTSLDTLEFIQSKGGFGYIAHFNSSPLYSKATLSGTYKKRLLSSQRVIGVSNLDAIEKSRDRIMIYSTNEPQFVIDNDSHTIEKLMENHFWIKGTKRTFGTIIEALHDYDISVSLVPVAFPSTYIEGVYIQNTETGFLTGCDNNPFCTKFSPALNCLIGGRGTGKSSVLEVLEYTLSQRCDSKEKLDFLCAHGNVFVLYHHGEDEYFVVLRPPKKNPHDDILKCFGQNIYDRFGFRYYFDMEDVKKYTLSHYVSVYKVIHQEKTWGVDVVPNTHKQEILKMLFDTRYSVNELVNTAGSANIHQFIYDTMFSNEILSNPGAVVTARRKSGLRKMLDDTTSALEKRSKEVHNIIDPFNLSQDGILRINYYQTNDYDEPPIYKWLFGSKSKKAWYKKINITNEDIEQFMLSLYSKLGLWDFLNVVITENIDEVKKYENIMSYCTEPTQKLIDSGVSTLSAKDADDFVREILAATITDKNISAVLKYIKDYIANTEKYELVFNANNKEGAVSPVLYKPVNELSLGQKVVAMLSFVLGYSEYSHDYRPLIIDQPEDNLDNQYIYKNLVKQLREIKEKRQVIIATHNATIVTNAKADQVCVMQSSDKHGWIETAGYPGEKKIKKHIINYLEGGKDSFVHKMRIYEAVVKE